MRRWGRPADAGAECACPPKTRWRPTGLAAEGRDNDAIAAELVLSVRTIERRLENVYAKLGLQGRNARNAAVARLPSRA